jgi:hypothetical protein
MKAADLNQLKQRIVRVSRMHFYFALIMAVQIVIYDSWRLIVPEVVLQRWVAVALLFTGATVVWLLARSPSKQVLFYQKLIGSLVVIDVALASFMVYQTRGMASRAVLLYIIPIMTAAVFRSRAGLIATAFLSIAAYTSTTIAYFTLNFNEGYTVELYGEVGFYSAMLVLVSVMLWSLLGSSKKQ